MTKSESIPNSMVVRRGQVPVGIVVVENGEEVTRYFADEIAAARAMREDAVRRARELAGAWSDLDWEETITELERIRHENAPTPPIDDLLGDQ